MTLVAKIDGVTLPDGALLIGGAPNSEVPGGISGLLTAAWYGEAPSVGITLDDPAGDLDSVLSLGSLHTFTVDETACTGKERIWSGWLTANRVSRGPYSSGASRIWDIDIIDMNWAFNLMAFRASSAKRPAETDIVRVAFARASQPMAFTPLADNGRFNVTDNPVAFDEADYVTKFPVELFASVTGTAGKNFYAYYDHDEEELSIHYDLVGVGPTSTLSISNDIADTSSTCFYPFLDAELRQDGAWKVTGMLFQYKGAYAYGIRQPTIDALSPTEFSPVEFQRDEVYSTDRVGKLATAQALIARMLEERAQDRDTITCSIRVPAEQVNLVEAGDVIGVKFTHLPGYEDGVDLPVIRRNVVPTPGRVDSYDIHLELSGAAKPTGPSGGDPANFPPVANCEGLRLGPGTYESLHSVGEVLDGTIVVPSDLVGFINWRVVGAAYYGFDGWPAGGTGGTNYLGITAVGGGVSESIPDTGTPTLNPGGALIPFNITGGFDSASSANLKGHELIFTLLNGDNRESWHMELEYLELWGATDPNYPERGACDDQVLCPNAGQWTEWMMLAEGDGTTTDFTLPCPYADNGLLVKVDNLDITIGLTQDDPAAGEFSLDFAPKAAQGDAPAEQVWVKYLGR